MARISSIGNLPGETILETLTRYQVIPPLYYEVLLQIFQWGKKAASLGSFPLLGGERKNRRNKQNEKRPITVIRALEGFVRGMRRRTRRGEGDENAIHPRTRQRNSPTFVWMNEHLSLKSF
ncbi:hypothetical protein CDAR_303721 [Caerostris darwini]|uniref:Uncharacterized protein n=1 Tax=Caerostris darwini TaxID=1538125 RepID=A0AAV4T7H2_9ARAC|nr:hypothetical protein CDAR_303721 [Caerostris darwini]